ncbi:MAG: bifunctional pyr operon transcriptional regulator/uracil phosphoribosyltransferase PyrR [Myxococcota bacterium]
MSDGSPILSSEALDTLLDRLTDDLIAASMADAAFIGVYTGGAHLAARLVDRIAARGHQRPKLGTMDITMYRDDLYTGLEKPILGDTDIPFNVTGQRIVLVDDVLFTGRTIHAALRQMMDYGRPRSVSLLVLIDRGHRELPIGADFVGQIVDTGKRDKVVVKLIESGASIDGVDLIPQREG